MTKTRLEKIASYDEKIAHIKNLQKMERQKHSKEERAARTRRLRTGRLKKTLLIKARHFAAPCVS